MRSACLLFALSMMVSVGCSKPMADLPKPVTESVSDVRQQLSKQLTSLQEQNASLTLRVNSLEAQNATHESTKLVLENKVASALAEAEKMRVARDSALKEQSRLIGERTKELDAQIKLAANNFARMGNHEKQVAVQAIQKMKANGPNAIDKFERDLLAQVGTAESIRLVNEWDVLEAKKFGLVDGVVTILEQKQPADKSEALKGYLAEYTKQLNEKRKALKEVQTKGVAVKRQIAKLEGTESPIGRKKLKELETEFSDFETQFNHLELDISDLEHNIQEVKSGNR